MKRILALLLLIPCRSIALSIAPPQIVPSNTVDGATSLAGVHCLLYEGRNAGTVDGLLSIKTDMLGVGVNLAVWDADGNLLASWSVSPEKKGKLSVFWFILKKDFLANARLTVFTKDEMYEFPLKPVAIKTGKGNIDASLELITKQSKDRPTKPSTPTK